MLLPDNATLIRENIVDTFSCKDRIYGYYADMENECQIFHVCMPQTRGSIRWSFICPAETVFNQVNIPSVTFNSIYQGIFWNKKKLRNIDIPYALILILKIQRQLIFLLSLNKKGIIIYILIYLQATFVCTQTESSIPCEESEKYYALNEDIGKEVEEEEEADQDRGKKNATKILEPEVETVSKKLSPKNFRLLEKSYYSDLIKS